MRVRVRVSVNRVMFGLSRVIVRVRVRAHVKVIARG